MLEPSCLWSSPSPLCLQTIYPSSLYLNQNHFQTAFLTSPGWLWSFCTLQALTTSLYYDNYLIGLRPWMPWGVRQCLIDLGISHNTSMFIDCQTNWLATWICLMSIEMPVVPGKTITIDVVCSYWQLGANTFLSDNVGFKYLLHH